MHTRLALRRCGLTIVELLIVIFILAILMQLLLAAVQASRAGARKTQCQNNLRQLAVGAQLHMNAHGYLPSGGWSGAYTADPNRGYGKEQPGGWPYSLLAYIGENTLRDAGKGESLTADSRQPRYELFPKILPNSAAPHLKKKKIRSNKLSCGDSRFPRKVGAMALGRRSSSK